MKNLSLILNGISLLGVVILFFLFFSNKTPASSSAIAKDSTATIVATDEGIAYVNTDSLLNKYDFFKDIKKEMEGKRDKLEGEISGRARALENEIVYYQQKGRELSLEQAQQTERQLGKKQQDLVQYRDQVGRNLALEEQKKNEELYARVTDYLKKYSKDKNIKYVFGYTKGDAGLLFASDGLEITDNVVAGLNKEYGEAATTAEAEKKK